MTEQLRVHFIGIGGTGLSAIARLMVERGYVVTGSDRQRSALTDDLLANGVRVTIGHRSENVAGVQMVVRSSAIPDDNVEVVEAKKLGIPVLKRSEFLGSLMEGSFGIAVAGTHGKTTTTAMISWMLTDLGLDPSYIVGGILNNTGRNAHAGNGNAFVIEADEYDRMFLGLKPKLAVITNIEHDHPDCYPTEKDFFQAFDEFAGQVDDEGTLLVCVNDHNAVRLGEIARQRGQNVLTYALRDAYYGSMDLPADYLADELIASSDGGMIWRFLSNLDQTKVSQKIELHIPGRHNVQNALAAMAVAQQMQLPLTDAGEALSKYSGAGRRFELRGVIEGITIIDDYAHHPTEIKATLAAAHLRYPSSPMWVVWQPHTYSRTRLLRKEFAKAFGMADHVLVTEIYAARENKPEDGFSAKDVVSSIVHPDVRFIDDYHEISDYLAGSMLPGDILLVLSAGDADQISAMVKGLLIERSWKHE